MAVENSIRSLKSPGKNRLRAAPIFSQSVEREAKKKKRARSLPLASSPVFARSFFFFASRSTDWEKMGAARSLWKNGCNSLYEPWEKPSASRVAILRQLFQRNVTALRFPARFDLLNNLELLHQDMDRKDDQQERLLSQMKDLLTKYEESEEQKKRYMNELETVTKKLKEASKDVRELEEQLEERDNQLKESDKKRSELRNKALQSIKE